MQRWLGLILLLTTGSAWGCSCIGTGACGALKPHGAMFVGKVLSIVDEPPGANGSMFRRRIVRFAVGESFSDTQREGEELSVSTGMGGGDCGFPFTVGQRYFVDGYVSSTGIEAGICGRTSTEEAAAAVIRELRIVIAGGRVPDLSGRIATSGYRGPIARRSKGLEGVAITATAADGTRYQTKTDEQGIYAWQTLPPQKYTLDVAMPTGFLTYAEVDHKPLTVTIPDVGGVGAACHLDVSAEPGGRIIGRAANAQGKGVAGFVSAYSVPEDSSGGFSWNAATSVNADGTFTLAFLPEGEYRLEFWVDNDIKQRVYYPYTRKKAEAETVHVADGKATEEIAITVD